MSGSQRFSEGPQATVLPAALAGVRAHTAICIPTGVTRREASDLIDTGAVSVDGTVVVERNRRVREDELLEIHSDAGRAESGIRSGLGGSTSGIEFTVVHADDHVIVVDKPAGLVVHHGAGHYGGTLVDGLLERFPDLSGLGSRNSGPAEPGSSSSMGDPDRPGIV